MKLNRSFLSTSSFFIDKNDPHLGSDIFGHQPTTSSIVIDSNNQQTTAVAPCVPMVLGTKRERLPDETVIRRSKISTFGH